MKMNKTGKTILTCGLVGVLFFSGCSRQEPVFFDTQEMGFEQENTHKDEMPASDEYTDSTAIGGQDQAEPVVVHICGAVVSPGVYELPPGSRIIDAVNLAGGLSDEADESYVNLAGVPADGEQIFIPTYEEAESLRKIPQEGSMASGKVNINTADKSLLCSLPGIGDTRAADIIAYRQEHGGFAVIEDIMQVSGIKEAGFQKIKELITVN